MLRIVVLLTAAVLFALAEAPALQTGQTKSYDADGNVVPYGSIKDDGYYRAGVVRSYSRNGDVVIDNVTGLEWQDNVESVQKPWLIEANYNAGDYFNTWGDTAATYCDDLPLQGGGWRLPSIGELQTLVDYSQFNPSVTPETFNNISLYNYWSSLSSINEDSRAWHVSFYSGYSNYYYKYYGFFVRCVRSGRFTPVILRRSGEIVTDSATGLQWQDNSAAKSTKVAWKDAIEYCENTLVLGGHNDWRLPNINELLSIVNFYWYDHALNTCVFQNYIADLYWSSTTYSRTVDTSNAWQVDFNYGPSHYYDKSYDYYVRCVRGGQINIPVNPSIIMYLLN